MSASSGNQYQVGQHVRGKGIYFGTGKLVPLVPISIARRWNNFDRKENSFVPLHDTEFNMFADFNDVTVQDLMKTRGSTQAVGPSDEKFLLNAFRNAVHALNNAALPDIERIKDRPADRPDISYETELMKRLSSYRSGDLSGRFIPTLEILVGMNQEFISTGQPNILGTIWKNRKSNEVLAHTPYHSCTEAITDFTDVAPKSQTIGFHLGGLDQKRTHAYLSKNRSVAHLRLVRVECV